MRVLIVEDDRSVGSVLQDFLLELGHESELVLSAEGALDRLHQNRPDLILLDFRLPGINGLDATRQILDGSDRQVILLLSTYEEEEYAPRAAECGAAAYIPKSAFGPDRLSDAWAAATTAS